MSLLNFDWLAGKLNQIGFLDAAPVEKQREGFLDVGDADHRNVLKLLKVAAIDRDLEYLLNLTHLEVVCEEFDRVERLPHLHGKYLDVWIDGIAEVAIEGHHSAVFVRFVEHFAIQRVQEAQFTVLLCELVSKTVKALDF